MERIGDILQNIARQRGRGEGGPLVWLHAIHGTAGERVAHVPISHELYEAWLKLNSGPFRPHQSLALATLRRGEPLALRGASPAAAETARLLLYEALRANTSATGLLLLPTMEAAQVQFSAFSPLNAALSNPLPLALVDDDARAAALANHRLLITTPEILHHRLLRHHSRAWQPFWNGLQFCCVGDSHAYCGIAGTHLAALLLRSARLRPAGANRPLQLIATLAEVAGAEAALEAVWPQPWRVIPADDGALPDTTLAVWRGGADRLREAALLALALQRSGGYSVHLIAAPIELSALRQVVGDESGATTIGATPRTADVQIFAGHPGAHATLLQALRSGAQGTILVLGEQLGEQTLAQRARSLLDTPASVWAPPPLNTYVFTQHLLCAASELPLTQGEADAWQVAEMVARLERHSRLVRLPDAEPAWQPYLPADNTPPNNAYADFALIAAGSPAVRLLDERGQELGQLDAACFDRWGFVGAALPPGRARYRVISRDEDRSTLTLRPDAGPRRTYPLRRCQINVREELGERTLRSGRRVAWGKVMVDEEVYGYREAQQNAAPAELLLSPPLTTRWAAHALWFDVADTLNGRGQLAGWSLAAALPQRVLASFTDSVPAYSAADRRLYLVDAQPGGNGLAAWAFEQIEELLTLAYDIAIDCGADALLEPLARADKDWLLHMLRSEARPEALPTRPQPEEPSTPPVPPTLPQPAPAPPARHEAAPDTPRQTAPEPPVQPPPAQPTEATTNGRGGAARRSSAPSRRGGSSRRPTAEKSTSSAANNRSAPEPTTSSPPPARDGAPQPRVPTERTPATPGSPAGPPARAERDEPQAAVQPVQPEPPDASAMIARMKRLREERERRNGAAPQAKPAAPAQPVESRFKAGEKVFCLPYGDGIVRESRTDDGHELLVVDFPDFGALTIDPSVSLVRSIAPAPNSDDNVL